VVLLGGAAIVGSRIAAQARDIRGAERRTPPAAAIAPAPTMTSSSPLPSAEPIAPGTNADPRFSPPSASAAPQNTPVEVGHRAAPERHRPPERSAAPERPAHDDEPVPRDGVQTEARPQTPSFDSILNLTPPTPTPSSAPPPNPDQLFDERK
jgi:hypothetical protein